MKVASLPVLLARLRPQIEQQVKPLADPWPAFVLFFSLSDGQSRAAVVTATATTFADAWKIGVGRAEKAAAAARMTVEWLRVDWVETARTLTWKTLRQHLERTKRNYFRCGLSLDAGFKHAFLETELNANAMLYGGTTVAHAVLNTKNFARYAGIRHKLSDVDFSDDGEVQLFSARGAFASAGTCEVYLLPGAGLNAGRRIIERLEPEHVEELVAGGSRYLASQVRPSGRFHYGWHPCFDRRIDTYNCLRHASSLYAMIEAWEVTRDDALKAAIDKALHYLTHELIRQVELPSGVGAAFLVEENGEIKLGGNAVCLLALVRYSELTGRSDHLELLERLATGILHMQDPDSGKFSHVLNYPSLSVKEEFRIIYYDGEAAFGLMRLYGLTRDARWLDAVEKAFSHFIAAKHWQAHDHWLGYCVNELTRYRPLEAYYDFGIRNFVDYLDFVIERITTFPTLLELMMAAEQMVSRLRAEPDLHHLLDKVDLGKFHRALHARAHYLLNGHFWPELAMYFANPGKIAGSFFIRHHAFRIRIDDVEHYLSGFVAYLKYLKSGRDRLEPAADFPEPTRTRDQLHARVEATPDWNAADIEQATRGTWLTEPPPGWSASGLCIYAPAMEPGNLVAARSGEEEKGVSVGAIRRMQPPPAGVITSDVSARENFPGLPVLHVADPGDAILAMGEYARTRMTGKVLAVTGSAGKTTAVAMLADALQPYGQSAKSAHNANLPHGVSWNLASIGWSMPHVVLEVAIGKMKKSALIARPHIAIFTNIQPAHLGESSTIEDIARTKSMIFLGMSPGSVAVLNRDMLEWGIVRGAAEARGLRIVHYGTAPQSDFQLLGYDAVEQRVIARALGREIIYRLGAAGSHMALNSLAVLAAVAALGYPLEPALKRIEDFAAISGRGQEFDLMMDGLRLTVIDHAYNANPGSMRAAIEHLGDKGDTRRRVAVLGEMAELGPGAQSLHTELAPLVESQAIDRVYVMGELYAGFWERLPPARRGRHASSLNELKSALREELADDDVVLLKGSNSTGIHRVVAWMKERATGLSAPIPTVGAPGRRMRRPEGLSGLLYDGKEGRVVFAQREDEARAPASITKLVTLCLVEERLRALGISRETMIEVSPRAANVNSWWGFEAGERVGIDTLMHAAAIVSSNEAANALAEWHSGSIENFTAALNARAAELGLENTRFATPSGLGRRQWSTAKDVLALARHVIGHQPHVSRLCAQRVFEWKGKQYPNTNRLLSQVDGADGLKTGTLAGHGNNVVFSALRGERRWVAVILGAATKAERDEAVRTLMDAYAS
ncbi:Mur ligase family protein [Aquamicrobium sp. LC103]|uniref:Mur ligase family protein n=1 Tax=Aquamicrobium sp. LC103 TaxID=1120658 RepID=UPI001FEDA843|nr:Mur ligase family protein [Aquamicrobium sp. LC103]